MLIKNDEKDKLLGELKSIHQIIKFSYEMETKSKINYLVVMIKTKYLLAKKIHYNGHYYKFLFGSPHAYSD